MDCLTHFQEQDWTGPSPPLVSARLKARSMDGELMRRQRAGRRALHLPLLAITTDRFCLRWRFHSICLLLIKFKQFSVNFHGCVGMTKAWPWWRRWSHTLPLVRRGRGNNPSVPRLGLQPGLHDHHAGLSCLRENECSLNIPCSMLSLETVLG